MSVKRILIVDDSMTERQYLSEVLTECGYQCLQAVNGEDGIAKARSEHPDLILMDVVMPGTNGYQATRTLARDPQTQDIPIMLCTSKNQEADKVWGLRQGAFAYFTKPINTQQLFECISGLS
jgi:twitching motility two-component system response regulator PilH